MKYVIGIAVLVALCASAAAAQDADRAQRMAEIKKLEAQAEKLLDAGKRVQAFDALARAAVLRESLGKGRERAPEPKAKAIPQPATPKRSAVEQAADAFDAAVRSGNMQGIREAAANLRSAVLAAETRQREQLAAERRKRKQLEQRLTELEQQLTALKKLMAR